MNAIFVMASLEGYVAISRRDGRLLLAHLRGTPNPPEALPGVSAIQNIRRLNAPGLAKLEADLGFDRESR